MPVERSGTDLCQLQGIQTLYAGDWGKVMIGEVLIVVGVIILYVGLSILAAKLID